jgi:hypothetical protein
MPFALRNAFGHDRLAAWGRHRLADAKFWPRATADLRSNADNGLAFAGESFRTPRCCCGTPASSTSARTPCAESA